MKELRTVLIYLTNLSDSNCKYRNYQGYTIPEFNIEAVKETLDELSNTGVQKVIFTGGEILAFIDGNYLIEILKYAKDKGLMTGIVTNGKSLKEEFILASKKYLDEVNLLVDSIEESTNIKLGNLMSFKESFDINYLCYILKQNNIVINIHTTVTVFNEFEYLQHFINLVKPNYWLIENVDNRFCVKPRELKSEYFQDYVSKHKFENIVHSLECEAHVNCFNNPIN